MIRDKTIIQLAMVAAGKILNRKEVDDDSRKLLEWVIKSFIRVQVVDEADIMGFWNYQLGKLDKGEMADINALV